MARKIILGWFEYCAIFLCVGSIILLVIFCAAPTPVPVAAEPKGKQKKKGKKSGRTIQEEEDLDAILAELEGPSRPTPPAAEPAPVSAAPAAVEEPASVEKSLSGGAVVPDGEEVTESAASKKKKKKKEKEKAAKAGAGMWSTQHHFVQGPGYRCREYYIPGAENFIIYCHLLCLYCSRKTCRGDHSGGDESSIESRGNQRKGQASTKACARDARAASSDERSRGEEDPRYYFFPPS